MTATAAGTPAAPPPLMPRRPGPKRTRHPVDTTSGVSPSNARMAPVSSTQGATWNRYDLVVIGSGPGGQRCAVQAAKLGKTRGDRRTPPRRGRRVHQHRHDPEQDAARGGARPVRPAPARALRRGVRAAAPRHRAGPAWRASRPSCAPSARSSARSCSATASRCTKATAEFTAPAHGARRRRATRRPPLQAAHVAIAVGTRPGLPAGHRGRPRDRADQRRPARAEEAAAPDDGRGRGIIGLEYGSMLAALGVEVTLRRHAHAAARDGRSRDRRCVLLPRARDGPHAPARRAGGPHRDRAATARRS